MAIEQLTFFEEFSSALLTSSLVSAPELNAAFFQSYDSIISTFSGGKDSIAQTLTIIESGAPLEKIELWHHLIDGREGSELMDWPCTEGYCRAFAQAIGVPLYASWKKGGFEGELLRKNAPTATNYFETPGGLQSSGGCGPNGTRERFPQVSADLSVRWCSAYLKIDVAAAALRNQDRFLGKRVLFLTGERASESPGRAKYRPFEPHRTDLRHGKHYQRHVDHLRPVHQLSDEDVWSILQRWRINPHPAYRLGWGRCSCASCIFGSKNQWASLRIVNPRQFHRIADYESQLGFTIQRTISILEAADAGVPFAAIGDIDMQAVLARTWNEPIILPGNQTWPLPAGAFGDKTGPS